MDSYIEDSMELVLASLEKTSALVSLYLQNEAKIIEAALNLVDTSHQETYEYPC